MASPDKQLNRGFWDKIKENPWVPLGAAATAVVLGSGLYAFKSGRVGLSQQMMRLRVVAQGATVAVLVIGSFKAGVDFDTRKNEPHFIPVVPNESVGASQERT
mmetsp:Transcript_116992/g.164412  ORF Transcript_116992/g.164412 Transcript_116992/m.164412 type:complete len:103 (+) Transcript_116992:56-364(+)